MKRIIVAFSAEDIEIVGDNRTVSAGSKNSLPEYIKTEAYAKWGYENELRVTFRDSRDVKGLQVADLIANAVYAKYNLNKNHLYRVHESHYIERVKFPYATFGA